MVKGLQSQSHLFDTALISKARLQEFQSLQNTLEHSFMPLNEAGKYRLSFTQVHFRLYKV